MRVVLWMHPQAPASSLRGGRRRRPLLLAASIALACSAQAQTIQNPYWDTPNWRIWTDDESPVSVNGTLLTPTPAGSRLWGDDVDPANPQIFTVYKSPDWPARIYSSTWDDVYLNFDGYHSKWYQASLSFPSGNGTKLTGTMEAESYYGGSTQHVSLAGANWSSQSTTGMGHERANSGAMMAPIEEYYYFQNCLRAGPGHLSHTEDAFFYNTDRYEALTGALYNSQGSSGTEMDALGKMMTAGSFLPAETKLLVKREGIYTASLLYIFKASLPYDVPYANELRHRVTYASDPGNYNRVYTNHGYHEYDGELHLANMVELAKGMTVAPPIALLDSLAVLSGTQTYALKTTMLVQQAAGEAGQVLVSVNDSYDVNGLPLTHEWTLLYGNQDTTIADAGGGTYLVTVPDSQALPAGRTTVMLSVSNGVFDSNPAFINFYRADGAINYRPSLEVASSVSAAPGDRISLPITSVDRNGLHTPLIYERDGEVGGLQADSFVWDVPVDQPGGVTTKHLIASSGLGGFNSAQIEIEITPTLSKLSADVSEGLAPLSVQFDSAGSRDVVGSALSYGWDFDDGSTSTSASPTHHFTTPGVYEVRLTVTGLLGSHTATELIHATNSYPLVLDGGWDAAAVDPAVWAVDSSGGGSALVNADGELELRDDVVITTQQSLSLPYHVEYSSHRHYPKRYSGMLLSDFTIGSPAYDLNRIMASHSSGAEPVSIGSHLWAGVDLAGDDPRYVVNAYAHVDPNNPGKMRLTGQMVTGGNTHRFSMDGQDVSELPLSFDGHAPGGVHTFDYIRIHAGDTAQPPLTGSPLELSLASGGAQVFTFNAGPQPPVNLYLLMGSSSGTAPGVPVDGLVLPLNLDAFLMYTLENANTAVHQGSLGSLLPDGTTSSAVAFNLPPALDPSLAGSTLHHAYVVFDLTSSPGTPFVSFVSNPVPLTLGL